MFPLKIIFCIENKEIDTNNKLLKAVKNDIKFDERRFRENIFVVRF